MEVAMYSKLYGLILGPWPHLQCGGFCNKGNLFSEVIYTVS